MRRPWTYSRPWTLSSVGWVSVQQPGFIKGYIKQQMELTLQYLIVLLEYQVCINSLQNYSTFQAQLHTKLLTVGRHRKHKALHLLTIRSTIFNSSAHLETYKYRRLYSPKQEIIIKEVKRGEKQKHIPVHIQ